jgi:hypothetical protein
MILFFILSVLSAMAQPVGRPRLVTREVSLGRWHAGETIHSLTASPDLRHIAYAVKKGNAEYVALDGVPGKRYSSIPYALLSEYGPTSLITFSPDSRRLAYVAKRGAKFLVVVDGVEGKLYDSITSVSATFSASSRTVRYEARRDTTHYEVVDGIEYVVGTGSLQGAIALPALPNTTDARIIRRDGKSVVVTSTGREGRPYDSIEGVAVVRLKGVYYKAYREGGAYFVVNGIEYGPHDDVDLYHSRIVSSYRFGYVAIDSGHKYMMIDDQRSRPYDYIFTEPIFDATPLHAAYLAGRNDSVYVVIDGVEHGGFVGAGPYPMFSPDSRHLLYTGTRNDTMYVVIDSVTHLYEEIRYPAFSPDSRRLAFAVRHGSKWRISVDGVEQGSAFASIDRILFTPDSRHLIYDGKREGKSIVVIDSLEGSAFDYIGEMQFSPDSTHVVYTAERGPMHYVVVDGIESVPYDLLLADGVVAFDGPDAFHFLAMRGREYLRVEERIAR